MNSQVDGRHAWEEAAACERSDRLCLVRLRCSCRTVVGAVYDTEVGTLLVSTVSVKATAIEQGAKGFGLSNAEAVRHCWLLDGPDPVGLADSLTTRVPVLHVLGPRMIRLHCPKCGGDGWRSCSFDAVLRAVDRGRRSGKPYSQRVPC